MPLTLKASNKHSEKPFNLIEIKKQMEIATNLETSLDATQIAIRKMYQNGTTEILTFKTQASANALVEYFHNNKNAKDFTFKLGQVGEDKQLLLAVATKGVISLPQNEERVAQIYSQNAKSFATIPTTVSQPLWISHFLKDQDFGILLGIYQKRVVSQKSVDGTKIVDATIKTHDFKENDSQDQIYPTQTKMGVNSPIWRSENIGQGMVSASVNIFLSTKDGGSIVFKETLSTQQDTISNYYNFYNFSNNSDSEDILQRHLRKNFIWWILWEPWLLSSLSMSSLILYLAWKWKMKK